MIRNWLYKQQQFVNHFVMCLMKGHCDSSMVQHISYNWHLWKTLRNSRKPCRLDSFKADTSSSVFKINDKHPHSTPPPPSPSNLDCWASTMHKRGSKNFIILEKLWKVCNLTYHMHLNISARYSLAHKKLVSTVNSSPGHQLLYSSNCYKGCSTIQIKQWHTLC